MNKNNYVIKTKKYDCVDYAQIETTHKLTEKIRMLYFYVDRGGLLAHNYAADIKLNVLDCRIWFIPIKHAKQLDGHVQVVVALCVQQLSFLI